MISSCNNKSNITKGNGYKAINSLNIYQDLLKTQERIYFVVNTELILQKDTFSYKTCAIKGNGKWYKINDSVHLEFKNTRWIKENIGDSIPQSEFNSFKYLSIKDYLVRTVDTIEGHKLVEMLKKNK